MLAPALPCIIQTLAVTLACVAVPALALSQDSPGPSSSIAGIWLGSIHVGPQTLRVQVQFDAPATGPITGTLDSPDQKTFGIPCSKIQVSGTTISFDVPAVAGKWTGQLSADNNTLTGTWTQGRAPSLPLTFERQQTAIAAPPTAAPDPAMPPVSLADLKSVLDRDLAAALDHGALAPGTHAGIAIGVILRGERRVFTYGTAKPDSVFEIGSITKTFTSLLLAQMAEQGTVKLDEPVRQLLPPGTVAKPASGEEITLIRLSDQHSGLPRMPENFHPPDPTNPYADYDTRLLYAAIAKLGVALSPHAGFEYSNLGAGLLGQALANRAKLPFATLLEQQITGPLGMHDTAITLTPELKARFLPGYNANHQPARPWDLDALVGAGGIRSTASDMLIYLDAQLHPDHLPATTLAQPNGKTLPAAIANTHIVRADTGPLGMHIAMAWLRIDDTGSYWHNGGTASFTSYATFNPEKDFAVIVLNNTAAGPEMFTDKLGQHVVQRLTGLPAVSLAPAN